MFSQTVFREEEQLNFLILLFRPFQLPYSIFCSPSSSISNHTSNHTWSILRHV